MKREILENLVISTQTKKQMQGGLFFDLVVRQVASVLKLPASKDETLLVWRDTLLALNLSFDIFHCVERLDLQGDGLANEVLHEDLHTLNVVVRQGTSVLRLLAGEDIGNDPDLQILAAVRFGGVRE